MTRHNHERSSTITMRPSWFSGRLAAALAAILVAFALVFSLSGNAAWAQENAGHGKPSASDLVPGQVQGTGSATVLVYLNGSDLESYAGEATSDIAEMIDSGIGNNANVVIETIGTSEWQEYGIASDHTQRYAIEQGKLELVDDSLGQLASTSAETLSDFISWGVKNYPADRYILVMWDHGAGPVYGFGYDEFQAEGEALTLDEIKQALQENSDVHFDIIGMDCCIMSSLETTLVLQPYCDYAILSEDFEPGIGWSYERWMGMLEKNPSTDTAELGTAIVDDMVAAVAADPENGEATLALIDESKVDELYDAWVSFAYANAEQLLGSNYSQEIEWQGRPGQQAEGRVHGEHGFGEYGEGSLGGQGHGYWDDLWESWEFDDSYVTMTDYFITDIKEVTSQIQGAEATALEQAMDDAIVHYRATAGEEGMSGLGVTLPYGDAEFYDQLEEVFKACGIDGDYVDWLESFVGVEGAGADGSGNGHGSDDGSGYGYEGYYGYGLDEYYGYDDEANGYGYGYGYDDEANGYGYGYGYGLDEYYGYDGGYGPYDDGDYAYGYGYGYDGGYGSSHGYGYGYGYGSGYGSGNGYDFENSYAEHGFGHGRW